jgi:hypothetical protein
MRELLASLVLPTPRFSRALGCLQVLNERIPQDPPETAGPDPTDPLVDALRALTPRLVPELSSLLEHLLRHCGSDVRRMLACDPWSELQTILDWLEPVDAQGRYGQVLEGTETVGEGASAGERLIPGAARSGGNC